MEKLTGKNAIILCSGGIDSVTTAFYVKKKLSYEKLKILFFNYGQRGIDQERRCSKNCAKELHAEFKEIVLPKIKIDAKVKKVKDLRNTKKESDNFYIPFRNSLFIVHALSLAESLHIKDKKLYDIFVGFKCEGKETYPDTTKKYVKKIIEIIALHSFKGKLKTPLINKDKNEIVLLGDKLGVDFRNTYSCYSGEKDHCGTCLACRLRMEGFYWANKKDPTYYLQN
ncbi:7-cyano-7-deazaguanine synthase [Candidatus Pacearchaeota archaeon]|nr:7-cyano-7-deazaguanine synthase [Candidatus Pacearchaeota archaeon]